MSLHHRHHRIPRLRSRHRITMRIALALIVLWTVGGWLTAHFVRDEMIDRIDADLRFDAADVAVVDDLDAQQVASLSEAVFEILPTGTLESIGEQTTWGTRDEAFFIIGPDGVVLGPPTAGPDAPEPGPDLATYSVADLRGLAGEPFTIGDTRGRSERFRVVVAPLQNGNVVVSARSLEEVEEMERLLTKVLTSGVVMSLGTAVALVWMISRHALKPLEDVIGTAHAVGAGTLHTRVEVASSAPDVGRLGDAMNTMLARLEEAFAAKELSEARLRQFVADASHELRTPLAAVLGYAELYREGIARTPEQVAHAMERIVAEGTRMQSLVEDLLLLARMDEGRELARDAVDLSHVAGEAVMAITTIDKGHTFVFEPSAGPVDVVGDGLALRQVIDNLLANVVSHTPDGTRAVVSLDATDGEAVVVVRDNGPGMAGDDADRAFDRFWRAERARSRPGGSGLGLAIVAELVRAHGGTIALTAAPGDGCTFTIRLPRKQRHDAGPRPRSAVEHAAAATN